MSNRSYPLLLIACLAASASWAANDPFVGGWKLNPSKSKLIDYMKVKSLGANKYVLDLGGGATETIVADGTSSPATTASRCPSPWRGPSTMRGFGRFPKTGRCSANHFTSKQPDGSTFRMDYAYKRMTAGSGFAATWVSTSEPQASELHIRPYAGGGLSFIDPSDHWK
jgi:hypothetical protein